MVKKFFGITENKYMFEVWDITTLLTILNVTLILCGVWFAPMFGIINCFICLIINVKNNSHINTYLTQIALIILNCYFLR